jgi:hypothetical protein
MLTNFDQISIALGYFHQRRSDEPGVSISSIRLPSDVRQLWQMQYHLTNGGRTT